jgi:hypothetical protein
MIGKEANNKLAVAMARDRNYRFLKNGKIQKFIGGKFRTIGTERHGYTVVTYKGKKLVAARVIAARKYLDLSVGNYDSQVLLNNRVIVHKNGRTLDNRVKNLVDLYPAYVPREETKRLTKAQITAMVALFKKGNSVAKIARRFKRKISRSHLSQVIKRNLEKGI